MTKRAKDSEHPAASRVELPAGTADAGQPAPSSATRRKPYQRPVVQKRRSVSEATLVSGGGVGGALAGGNP